MFANFELWSGGLVKHSAAPRQPRSTRGCLPCRQDKKKCDEQKPTCGRCKRRDRVECVWRSPSRAVSPQDPQQDAASLTTTCSRPGPLICTTSSAAESFSDALGLPSLQPSTSSMLLLHKVDGMSADSAWSLFQLCNHVLHGVYFDDQYTLLAHNLPLFDTSPPFMYAWLSLSAMQAAQQQRQITTNGPWLRTALRFHSKALLGLSKHLESSPITADWALGAMIVLHVFEKFGDERQPPSFAHIATARHLFLTRFTHSPPASLYQVLQIDSLVYRLAVISTFHPATHSHYECVSELVQLSRSSNLDCNGPWRHSLWISVSLDMFDTVFKLSFLLRQTPLNAAWASKLDQLEADLRGSRHMPAPVTIEQDTSQSLILAEQSSAAHNLYTCACLIIVAKLRDNEATASCIHVHQTADFGIKIICHLTQSNFSSPVLLWPVSIIGLAAQSQADRLSVTTYIDHLEPKSGLRATKSIRRLLAHAWDSAHGGSGLDVLFDERILREVFL